MDTAPSSSPWGRESFEELVPGMPRGGWAPVASLCGCFPFLIRGLHFPSLFPGVTFNTQELTPDLVSGSASGGAQPKTFKYEEGEV